MGEALRFGRQSISLCTKVGRTASLPEIKGQVGQIDPVRWSGGGGSGGGGGVPESEGEGGGRGALLIVKCDVDFLLYSDDRGHQVRDKLSTQNSTTTFSP